MQFNCALALLVATGALAACSHGAGTMAGGLHRPDAVATARLDPTLGNGAAGTLTFHQHGDRVMVMGRVTGLRPGAEHDFHVHEKGDCSSGDGNSAGGHFNPASQPHGPQHGPHHAGDMPSLKSDAEGAAKAMFWLSGVTLAAGTANSLIGRGVIVHAQPDDYATQPTGNSGARVACGVVVAG